MITAFSPSNLFFSLVSPQTRNDVIVVRSLCVLRY